MITKIRFALFFLLFRAGLCAADMEERILFGLSKNGVQAPVKMEAADFASFEQKLLAGTFDPQAQSLLAIAQEFTLSVFNITGARFLRAITSREKGDTIVAEWQIEEPFARGILILEDTPVYSNYLFRLSNSEITSKEDLRRLLAALLIFDKPPIELSRLQLNLRADGVLSNGFAAQVWKTATYDKALSLMGSTHGKELFLRVRLGKAFTSGYYTVPPFIPERFPPLTEIIKSWDVLQIRREVGKDLTPTSGVSGDRDIVLIGELVRRGLSRDEFVELLQNAKNLPERASLVLGAMSRSGQEMLIDRYFESALVTYESMGPRAAGAVETLFRHVSHNCNVKIEPYAVRIVHDPSYQVGALAYLGRCASSAKTLEQLRDVSVRDDLSYAKDSAEAEIRKRLGKSQ